MHVVATNVILWIRTLIKESLHEIVESEKILGEINWVHAAAHAGGGSKAGDGCNLFFDRIREAEEDDEACKDSRNEILGEALHESSPYLFPFVIEYVLIGASVLFVMWRHVGKRWK